MSKGKSGTIKVPIREFGVQPLPESVKAKWQPFRREQGQSSHEKRSLALKDASFRFYKAFEEARQSTLQQRHIKLSDVRSRAAAAAAAAANASHSDSERSAVLASRMLANMKAAEQRRLEAQQAQHARLAARSELVMNRLAQSQNADKARRQRLLTQLLGRLANAEQQRQAASAQKSIKIQKQRPGRRSSSSSSTGQLKRIMVTRGMEEWAQDLSPKTAAKAVLLRAHASSTRLQRTWRRFASTHKTTAQLARTFATTSVPNLTMSGTSAQPQQQQQETKEAAGAVPGSFVMIGGLSGGSSHKHERFEDFASKLQSPNTLRAAQALFKRLEQRLAVRGVTNDGAQSLLHQLSPSAPKSKKLERYPVRVVLCAYMIQAHPEVVFNKVGDIEARLSSVADQMLGAFEALLASLLQPLPSIAAPGSPTSAFSTAVSCPSPLTKSMAAYTKAGATATVGTTPAGVLLADASSRSSSGGRPASPEASPSQAQSRLASLLVTFDEKWLEYLDQFVVWKGHDARGLEVELMRMAIKLERSMRLKLGRREADSAEVLSNPDLRAMVEHVSHDHALLAERIARLTGPEGSARLAAALEHVRQQVAEELAAAEAEEAAMTESMESRPEMPSDSPPRRSPSRSLSRGASLQDPLSDAQALEAAQRAAAQQTATAAETAATSADAPEQQPETLSNEAMVWEMLYTGENYALPTADVEAAWQRAMGKDTGEDQEFDPSDVESMTPQQLTSVVAGRARVVAERAFWDSIVWRFKLAVQGQALPMQVAPLLSELGTELSGFVTDSLEAQHLAEQFTEAAVLARLTSRTGQQGAGANLTALGSMMEQLAQTLLRSGTPERASESAEVTQALHMRLAAVLAEASHGSSGGAPPADGGAAVATALAEALAAALRLLMTQLKLVKVDAANARLAGLARAMRERGAVSYLQTKLAVAWQLPTGQTEAGSNNDAATSSSNSSAGALAYVVLAEKLPHTAAWLSRVQSEVVPQLQGGLNAAGLLLDPTAAAAAVVAGGLQNVELRTGVRVSPAASPGRQNSFSNSPRSPAGSSGSSSGSSGPVKPTFPVTLDSWQGAVRAGLLALVTGDTPAASRTLPEVLAFDAARLHDLQNSMQQLLVTAAGLLIVQQLRGAAGLPWDAEARVQARRRLMVVLADPGMKLTHLVTELSQLAGAGAVATEQRVTTMFTTIVNPEAAAFNSIRSTMACALAAHLLYGRAALAADGAAASSCSALLARVGAAVLADDVAELGDRLAGVAAVSEAVHGKLLALLFSRQ